MPADSPTKMYRTTLEDAIQISPNRPLRKGAIVKKIAMQDVRENQRKITSWSLEEHHGSGVRFRNGDTLLARITPSLENGKTAYVDILDNEEIAYGSTEFIVLTAKEEITNPLFVYYLARSPEFRQFAIKSMTGTSGRQRVPVDALKKYELFLPPLAEQRRIAHILGTLDDKIELNRRMNATLEAIARALFKSWFVDFDPVHAKAAGRSSGLPPEIEALFPDSFADSELGPIPSGWEVGRIGEVVEVVGGGTPSTKNPEYWEGGDHAFATPKDLSSITSPILLETEKRVTEAGVKRISSGLLPGGTLLMSSRAPVGYLAIAAIPVCVNQGFIAMKCKEIPNYFVLNWAQENMSSIEAVASGTTFPEVSKANFRPLQILLPPSSLIALCSNQLENLYFLIERNLKQTQMLRNLREELLTKLIQRGIQR